jgi:hypothetical protein
MSAVDLTRRQAMMLLGSALVARPRLALTSEVQTIAPQPYFATVLRALGLLDKLGSPVAPAHAEEVAALSRRNDADAVSRAENILSRYVILQVTLQPDGYASTTAGQAQRLLIEQGWRVFLVRIVNPLDNREQLRVSVERWPPLFTDSTFASRAGVFDVASVAPYLADAAIRPEMHSDDSSSGRLSGFDVEYRVLQIYSRDRGTRRAEFDFFTADQPYSWFFAKNLRRGVSLDFECLPARDVALRVLDADGLGCVAALTIKDRFGRVYPAQAMRLAPDMRFHAQIYRGDGETVKLPDGEYVVAGTRGPEYIPTAQPLVVNGRNDRCEIRLQRWIDPSAWHWYPGETHIHAAGCAHYEHPTEGVTPETMIRHVRGEGLAIGQVLSWGPGWYYQKQFFQGHAISPAATLEHPDLQLANNATWQPRATAKDAQSVLRYDLEISGFPSSHCGHLVLLRLREQDYPGSRAIQDWPSWNLPILRWARAQGAVLGYAHCGGGMTTGVDELPNYEVPPMDGHGTQEAIVDVTHGLVDFLSGCDTDPVSELNAWYHMLNCGFRLAMVGETDYPCLFERVGNGRSYVRMDRRPIGDAGYEDWLSNLRRGRLYCGDGRSHFLEFTVQGRSSGDDDVKLTSAATVRVAALVAARLEERSERTSALPAAGMSEPPWHLERARIGDRRVVAVELVVNGTVAERIELVADGAPRHLQLDVSIAGSSWLALRILPSGHTHPVFVTVNEQPLRASRRSAQWCQACIDRLWSVKSRFFRETERDAARDAFDHARAVYARIAAESEVA